MTNLRMPEAAAAMGAPSEANGGEEVQQPLTNDGHHHEGHQHEHKHPKKTPVAGMHGVGGFGELTKDKAKHGTYLKPYYFPWGILVLCSPYVSSLYLSVLNALKATKSLFGYLCNLQGLSV